MRAQACSLALLVTLLAVSGAGPAAAILTVSGRATGIGEEPLKDARALLVPWVSSFEMGRLALEGKAGPDPAATVALSADGSFRLDVPSAGMWKVVVQAPGFVPQEYPLLPLLEDTELPGATLEKDVSLKVRVSSLDGRAIAGARVVIGDRSDASSPFFGRQGWQPPVLARLTDEQGLVVFPRSRKAGLLVRAGAAGFIFQERADVRVSNLSLKLDAGRSRDVRVVDAAGKSVSGALIVAGDTDWPIGRASQDGILSISIPAAGRMAVSALAEDGRSVQGVVAMIPPANAGTRMETGPRELRLPVLQELAGRVVSRVDGHPISGALVWGGDPGLVQLAGADGSYKLAVLPGQLTIQAAAPGFFEGDTIWLAKAGDRRAPTLVLEPAFAAGGIVVDEQGRPVEGVEVRAWAALGGRFGSPAARSGGTVRTSAAGRFRIPTLAAGIGHTLRLLKAGYAPAEAELPALEPGRPASDLKIVLHKGRTVFGRVVGPSDQGVAGAEVVLDLVPSGDERMSMGRLERHEAVADAAGRFEIRDLRGGVFELTARSAGFASTTVPGLTVPEGAGATDLGTVVLVGGVDLEGIVTGPDGQPLEGATVEVTRQPSRSLAASMRGQPPPPVATGADGFFRIEDRRAGEVLDVVVKRAGYAMKRVAGVQVPPAEPLRIALEPSATVEGRTVDPDGKPIPGAQVLLLSGGFKKATTGDDGTFRMEDVAPGPVRLEAMAVGWQGASLQNLEVRPGQVLRNVEVVLQPGSLVEGRVLSPGGRPLAGAFIQSVDRTGRMIRENETAMSDGDGYYRMNGVAPGLRTFAARHDDFRKATREVEVKPGQNTLDLALEGGVDVSGRVVDEAGLPVSGAKVFLSEGGLFWGLARAVSGQDGSFTLEGVAEGSYRIAAEKQGYARDEDGNDLAVGNGPVSGVEVRLSRGGAIVGQISGLDFPELSRVRIRIDRSDNFGLVAPDGSYRIEAVPPGERKVIAEVGSRQTGGTVKLEPGAVEARLDLDFQGGLVLSGILTLNGEPLQRFPVALNAPGMTSRTSDTDFEGRFRFEGLEEGRYDLKAGWRRPGQFKETVELSRDMEIRIDLVAVTLIGRVVDSADGSPLAGAEVKLLEPEGEEGSFRTETSDSKGEFRLPDVPEGSWRVRAHLAGYAPDEVKVEVQAGAPQERMEIQLRATEGMTLEVFLPSGRPPSVVRTVVLDPADRVIVSASYPVSDEGRLRIASVPPGTWELLLDADGAAPVSMQVTAPGHAGRVLLPPPGELILKVPDLQGARVRARAALTDANGKPYRLPAWSGGLSVLDLEDGVLRVERLAPGTWKLAVTAADGRTWSGTATVLSSSRMEVTLE